MDELYRDFTVLDMRANDLFFLGDSLIRLFQDVKAYRENFGATATLKQVPRYFTVYQSVLYRCVLRDGDVSLSCLVYIAPDRYPLTLMQPIIYDSPHGINDQVLVTEPHMLVIQPKCNTDQFFKLSALGRFKHYITLLKPLPISQGV